MRSLKDLKEFAEDLDCRKSWARWLAKNLKADRDFVRHVLLKTITPGLASQLYLRSRRSSWVPRGKTPVPDEFLNFMNACVFHASEPPCTLADRYTQERQLREYLIAEGRRGRFTKASQGQSPA